MTRRTILLVSLALATAAAVGCQVVSGASSLDIVDDAGASSETGGGSDAGEDAFRPLPDGSPGLDATSEADAPFVACTVPEGGAFTTCAKGGIADVASCVEYCATKGKCCAEDCKPILTDKSIEAAQLNADTQSTCIDPLSGPPIASYTACSNSPIPGMEKYFKCCCR